MFVVYEDCINRLIQWHSEQRRHFTKQPRPELYARVTQVLLADREKAYGTGPGTPEIDVVALVEEIDGVSNTDQQWTEAKRPSEHWKDLKMSGTTWRNHIRKGYLIVERLHGNKNLVRIRMDSYLKYKGIK